MLSTAVHQEEEDWCGIQGAGAGGEAVDGEAGRSLGESSQVRGGKWLSALRGCPWFRWEAGECPRRGSGAGSGLPW